LDWVTDANVSKKHTVSIFRAAVMNQDSERPGEEFLGSSESWLITSTPNMEAAHFSEMLASTNQST
jgi:hypothetical protein